MYKVVVIEDEDIIRKGLLFLIDWARHDCLVVAESVDGKVSVGAIGKL